MTRTVLITGGSRGIGRAAAAYFAARQWQVIITSRNLADADNAAAEIGPNVHGMALDVRDEIAIRNAFAEISRRHGRLDALVNNAAVCHLTPFPGMNADAWNDTFHTNVTGLMLCCQEAFPLMKKNGGGSIVNIGSIAGVPNASLLLGFEGTAAYVASKFAVSGLSEALAIAGKPFRVRVNCLSPGSVNTAMQRNIAPDYPAKTQPEDLSATIYYFADSSQSGMVTGSNLSIFCHIYNG